MCEILLNKFNNENESLHGRMRSIGIKEKADREDLLADLSIVLWNNRTFVVEDDSKTLGYISLAVRNKCLTFLRERNTHQVVPFSHSERTSDEWETLINDHEEAETLNPIINRNNGGIKEERAIRFEVIAFFLCAVFKYYNYSTAYIDNPSDKTTRPYYLQRRSLIEKKLEDKNERRKLLLHLQTEFPEIDF